jgi:hyperosmotically inducible protein
MRNFFIKLLCSLMLTAAAGVIVLSGQDAEAQNAAPGPSQSAQSNATATSQAGAQDQSSGAANEALTPESQDRLIREIRHELVMLPYYGVFDNLVFSLNGRNVTLSGQVTNPTLKNDAGNVVKRIEGVESVTNNIEVLPPSSMDDRTRRQVYNSIYSYGPLFKYGNMAVPPIHIIVKSGRITLDGVVDSEGDKNLAGMRANLVPGTFGVTNNLRVINPGGDNKKK